MSNVASYSSSIDDLKIENKALRNQVKDITLTLAMFIQGKENLNILLENQKKILNRTGLWYNIVEKYKTSENVFMKQSSSYNCFFGCDYCGRKGYLSYKRRIKKMFYLKT